MENNLVIAENLVQNIVYCNKNKIIISFLKLETPAAVIPEDHCGEKFSFALITYADGRVNKYVPSKKVKHAA